MPKSALYICRARSTSHAPDPSASGSTDTDAAFKFAMYTRLPRQWRCAKSSGYARGPEFCALTLSRRRAARDADGCNEWARLRLEQREGPKQAVPLHPLDIAYHVSATVTGLYSTVSRDVSATSTGFDEEERNLLNTYGDVLDLRPRHYLRVYISIQYSSTQGEKHADNPILLEHSLFLSRPLGLVSAPPSSPQRLP